MENNEEKVIILNDEIGMKIDYSLADFYFNREKYKKIDKKISENLNHLIQAFPSVVNLANNKKVYRVIYDKGLGELQKVAGEENLFRGNVIDKVTKKIVTGVKLEPLSNIPQLVGGIFSILSIATGQYFMAEINNNLNKIEKKISEIQQFLENDKISKLKGNEEFLKNTQKSINYILENEKLKLAKMVTIQEIEREALSNIDFYKKQINELNDISIEKDKSNQIIDNIEKKCNLIRSYWYSLFIYCYAVHLEVIISQNYNKDNLKLIKEDITEKCNTYKENHKEWSYKLKNYIEKSKALKNNKVLLVLKEIHISTEYINLFFWPSIVVVGGIAAVKAAAGVAYKVDKNKKEKKKSEAQQLMDNFLNICKDIKEIEMKRDEITLFDRLYNHRLELIKENNDIYIKISE